MEIVERFVLEQLAAWEVPGCAVAAVGDGRIRLAAGWGQRDLATKLPVTSDTLFAIGSTTKAFTAATVGAVVDDGLLEWERPLRDYVPELRLADPVVTDRLTVVDLLSHRSGLPRHDLAWLGYPSRSRAELVRRLRFLPLSRDLRQEFQYCNLGYLLAGHAVEVLCGTSWEDYLRTRLLTPLEMGRSNLSADDMTADADHAAAYERRQGVVVPVPQRPVTALAPAGALNSCASDMARWLLAQLGGGQVDGRVVMSPDTVARQHAPHIVLPEDRTFPASTRHAYGLGWKIGRYRDHRLAEHGGGIDGFQTECMLLPDDGIGVAVLTNTSSSAMAPVVAYRVLDELLRLEPLDWFSPFKAASTRPWAGCARPAARATSSRAPRCPGRWTPTPATTSTPATAPSRSPTKQAPFGRVWARWISAWRIATTRRSTWNGTSLATSPICSRSCSFLTPTATSPPSPSRSSHPSKRCGLTGCPTPKAGTPRSCAACAAPTSWVPSRSW